MQWAWAGTEPCNKPHHSLLLPRAEHGRLRSPHLEIWQPPTVSCGKQRGRPSGRAIPASQRMHTRGDSLEIRSWVLTSAGMFSIPLPTAAPRGLIAGGEPAVTQNRPPGYRAAFLPGLGVHVPQTLTHHITASPCSLPRLLTCRARNVYSRYTTSPTSSRGHRQQRNHAQHSLVTPHTKNPIQLSTCCWC